MFELIRGDSIRIFIALIVALFGILIGIISANIYGEPLGILYLIVIVVSFLLLLKSLFRPSAGLVIALIAIYNPVFNYYFLFVRQWEGGKIRVIVSTLFIIALLFGILLKRAISIQESRYKTPIDWLFKTFSCFAVFGTLYGFYMGNDVRLILSDLFPIAEFFAYFFITTWVIKSQVQATKVLHWILMWGMLCAFIEIVLYYSYGTSFINKFSLLGSGPYIYRLTDFMPALLLPIAIPMLFYERSQKYRKLLLVVSFSLLFALIFSFFRSLWVGVLLSTFFTLIITKDIRLGIKLGLLGGGIIGTVAVFVLVSSIAGHFELFGEQSMKDVIIGRLAYVEETSGLARISDLKDLVNRIFQTPLTGSGFGATYYMTDFSEPLALFSSSNFYLSMAAQLGIPAILCFFAAVLFCFKVCLRRLNFIVLGPEKGCLVGILASFVSMGVVLSFFPSLVHFPIPAYLGTAAALFFIISDGVNKRGQSPGSES